MEDEQPGGRSYPELLFGYKDGLRTRRRLFSERLSQLEITTNYSFSSLSLSTNEPEPALSPFRCMALDNTEQRYIVAASNNHFALFDLDKLIDGEIDEEVVSKLPPILLQRLQRPEVMHVSWLPNDNGLLVSSHFGGTVNIWDTSILKVVESLRVGTQIYSQAIANRTWGGTVDVAISTDKSIKILDLRSGKAVQSIPTFRNDIDLAPALVWDRYSPYLIYGGCEDGSVRGWDIRRVGGNKSNTTEIILLNQDLRHPISNLTQSNTFDLFCTSRDGYLACLNTVNKGTSASMDDIVRWRIRTNIRMDRTRNLTIIDDDTTDPLILVPGPETLSAFNALTGVEEWTKNKTANSDQLSFNQTIYNQKRKELYFTTLSSPQISVCTIY